MRIHLVTLFMFFVCHGALVTSVCAGGEDGFVVYDSATKKGGHGRIFVTRRDVKTAKPASLPKGFSKLQIVPAGKSSPSSKPKKDRPAWPPRDPVSEGYEDMDVFAKHQLKCISLFAGGMVLDGVNVVLPDFIPKGYKSGDVGKFDFAECVFPVWKGHYAVKADFAIFLLGDEKLIQKKVDVYEGAEGMKHAAQAYKVLSGLLPTKDKLYLLS